MIINIFDKNFCFNIIYQINIINSFFLNIYYLKISGILLKGDSSKYKIPSFYFFLHI